MSNQSQRRREVFLPAAGLIMAHQVAGKAVRDGLFLSQFSPSDLPKAIVLAAVTAVLLGMAFARMLSRYGPARLAPAAFAAGSLIHIIEFGLLRSTAGHGRGAIVVLIYLHLMSFGPILLSGFWSLAAEMFDPRSAKREFGRIAGGGTAGGVLGGLLAERGAAVLGGDSLLLLLGILHLAVWLVLRQVPSSADALAESPEAPNTWQAAREAFRQAPFLMNLAALVVIGAISATLLDYLFKSSAAAIYGKGPQLTRYFALFYTSVQVFAFVAQSVAAPVALKRLGLGRTMQWHSTAVAVGAGASLFLPPMVMAPVARALELVFRGSFFRSSYELFFTPAPPREKRAVKTFIDVTCDRVGDALGAGVLQILLLLGAAKATAPILIVTMFLAACAFWVTRRMDAGYSRVLEHGLLCRAIALNERDVQDSTTLAALLHTTSVLSKKTTPRPITSTPGVLVRDRFLERLADLRSGAGRRVQLALAPDQPYDPAVVPFAIKLLAWRESFEWARAFLMRCAHRCVGQLVDALLDSEQDFAVRRRIPHILAYSSCQRAVDGLTVALEDTRFEVRFHASRAIEFLHRMTEGLHFDHSALMRAVDRELASSPQIWRGRKLLDSRESDDSQCRFLDSDLRDRADYSLEYVFSLLAIQLPNEPLRVAFRALHSRDRMLHGLALEFLERHLSAGLVSQLRRFTEEAA